ncbi:unnamed protein product [Cuscuta epithymum]|nr:unnamed protein product [Cuscuta epithymum]
MYIFYL